MCRLSRSPLTRGSEPHVPSELGRHLGGCNRPPNHTTCEHVGMQTAVTSPDDEQMMWFGFLVPFSASPTGTRGGAGGNGVRGCERQISELEMCPVTQHFIKLLRFLSLCSRIFIRDPSPRYI